MGYGSGVSIAAAAAGELLDVHEISATVVDARYAKPLDAELIAQLAIDHELLATIEENVLAVGFGSAVAEILLDRDLGGACRLVRFGLPDRYVSHGDPHLLYDEIGLTPTAVVRQVAAALQSTSSIPTWTRLVTSSHAHLLLAVGHRSPTRFSFSICSRRRHASRSPRRRRSPRPPTSCPAVGRQRPQLFNIRTSALHGRG
jgi:hypothetical protein